MHIKIIITNIVEIMIKILFSLLIIIYSNCFSLCDYECQIFFLSAYYFFPQRHVKSSTPSHRLSVDCDNRIFTNAINYTVYII